MDQKRELRGTTSRVTARTREVIESSARFDVLEASEASTRGEGRQNGEPTEGQVPGRAGVSASSGAPRVLVVDDDPNIRTLCRLELEYAGLEVIEAGDGRAGLGRASLEKPDLVVTDMKMPRLDGFGLMAAIARNERTREIPIVVMSAEADPAVAARALSLGARAYLTKPFDPAELVERILKLVGPLARVGGARADATAHAPSSSGVAVR
jgi:CheY-like chemotaxis protein